MKKGKKKEKEKKIEGKTTLQKEKKDKREKRISISFDERFILIRDF